MTPTFLAHPTHYTIAEFKTMLAGMVSKGWAPKFPTLHNTGAPSLKQWLGYGPTPQERWGASLNSYYKGLGWHAGPHLVICPDYVWVLCDLEQSGVSVSCWNSITFGIEMVGDYDIGAQDDFSTGEGARVRDNAAAVLAVVADKFGWGDLADYQVGVRGLHFHRECTKDHHSCPGGQVSKPDMLARIAAARAGILPPAAPKPSRVMRPAYALHSMFDMQDKLNRAGAAPQLSLDGNAGPLTRAAIAAFQGKHGLFVDGTIGPKTWAALDSATA